MMSTTFGLSLASLAPLSPRPACSFLNNTLKGEMSSPLTLKYLTLTPTPLADVPDPNDPSFERDLIDEGTRLLEHSAWTERKSWHGGVVDTYTLPQGNVTYQPRAGGGTQGASPTGNPGDEGILWHKRVSTFKAREHGGYDVWWDALGDNHLQQEEEYVDNLVQVVDVGKAEGKKDCFLKLYKLPFGATDRSFIANIVVCSPSSLTSSDQPSQSHSSAKASSEDPNSKSAGEKGPREFIVFSLPVDPPTPPKEEKKYVRGTTATVERVRELEGGNIEWTCASLSTPGGSIPVKLSESKMAQSLADSVPSILTWMSSAHPPNSSAVKSGTYTADSAASAANPSKPRVTADLANPGGGMGIMPAGRLRLEDFQKEVVLRDF
ncbi:hypothetical protein JCM11251_005036 [Rhodosporidiobolus azoricus]